VDGAAVAYVEKAQIRISEAGSDGETGRERPQPPRRRMAGSKPEVDAGENEEKDEASRAESLVGIQGVQNERMRRSTRSSCDWNGSLQRMVSRSGSLSFRYTQSTR